MPETNRFKRYKPDDAATSERDICPDDALTLNNVPAIDAKGEYRDVIDSNLTGELAERHASKYRVQSITEAENLVEACETILHGDDETPGKSLESLSAPSRKAIQRVKREASEILRGLRAAVDELETTRDYPETRRNAERNRRRLRADGGTPQNTFGNVHVTRSNVGKCTHVMEIDNGRKILCGNSAKWRVDYPDGDYRRFCGVHKSDIEVLL